MEEVNITIIGAGVVGLAIASEISKTQKDVYVLERHNTFGQETSSRNSEVIHAGIYYPFGTLKAKTCVEGNALLYEICKNNNIPHKRIGKLIIATSQTEVAELETLYKKGSENGAKLRLISKMEIKKLEPNVEGIAGIYSPDTGILDSHSLMQCFIRVAKSNKAGIIYSANVVGIEKVPKKGYKVTVDNRERYSFITKILINSAGLESDKIAELVGIDIDKAGYRLKFCKGDYFSVGNNKNTLINHLIYPVPPVEGTGLGIHSTLDIQGRLRLGPDDYYITRDKFVVGQTSLSVINYSVDESKKEAFWNSVKKFLPFIELEDLSPEMSGIRPKLQGQGEPFRDFVIQEEGAKGFPGFINLIGIESPGLTSAPAIAKYVSGLVKTM